EWTELMAWVKEHDLSNSENYKYVTERIDVDSFMDYMICELYTGNSDYANIQYYKLPGGKWKWIYYDFCWGFGDPAHDTVTKRRGDAPAASGLFNALLQNSQWKDAFCRRFAELLNTTFTPEKVKAAVDMLYATVESEIERERTKFNGETFMGQTQHAECHGSYDSFVREVERIRKFADERPAKIKADLKEALSLSDSYMQEVFG
ncbi:MAG: CotH kinase family protein, partial [Clostridia bacterium]|nr:CotH kinase family protein [Clostridia bacterium]